MKNQMTQKEIEAQIENNLRRIAELDRKAEKAARKGIEAFEEALEPYRATYRGRFTCDMA